MKENDFLKKKTNPSKLVDFRKASVTSDNEIDFYKYFESESYKIDTTKNVSILCCIYILTYTDCLVVPGH